jgi:hypothetical protein
MTRLQVRISLLNQYEPDFGPLLLESLLTDNDGSGEETLFHGIGTREVVGGSE